MKVLIALLLISAVLGFFLALKLLSLKGTKLLADLSESMGEAQQANREILRRRFGHDSGSYGSGGGLFEVISSPVFGLACFAVAAMMFAHPESVLHHSSWIDVSVKGVFLMVAQVALLTLCACSISLMISQWRKK